MYSKVLEHARGFSGVLFGHDGDVAASRGRPVASERESVEGERARRLAQLRYVEERLRPLRETSMAPVYWRVLDELDRLGSKSALGLGEGERREPA